ncbi:MAG: helix-turn-helix domain-containing protein [Actinomycetota bacterium]
MVSDLDAIPRTPQTVPVVLSQLDDAVVIDPEFAHLGSNPVIRVRAAHSFDELEAAEPGDVVVLDPSLHHDVATYRFDLAVGRTTPGVAAVLGGRPSATGQRTASRYGIALGSLVAEHDVTTLAVLLRDLTRGGQQAEVAALERICRAADDCTTTDDIDAMLDAVARVLGRRVNLVRAPVTEHDLSIRVQGVVRWYLTTERPAASALFTTAMSYVARHVESLLQADYEARELPEATRSELVNEILLTDAGTSADTVGRLRQSGFPIDGSHCAICIDCHHPLPVGDHASAAAINTFRAQQRIADLVLDAVRRAGGTWTRAGTAASIVLVSSRTTSHGELVSRDVGRAAEQAIAAASPVLDELQIHVGIGTPHLGVGGLRTSVNEATTAVRSARDRGRANEAQHFDRLGFSRALLQWAEIDGVRPIIDEILGPLLEPTERGREALHTLYAYLQAGQNVSATADALHLHRNTVRYRIERIKEMLSVDLDDPDERLLVELGCRLVASEHEA